MPKPKNAPKLLSDSPPHPRPPFVPDTCPDAELARIAGGLQPLAVRLTRLLLDPKNARRHGERNVEAIAASLERWGQRSPLIARQNGVLVAGNGRLLAMLRLGWTWAAVLFVNDDPSTAAAFAIADNRTADLAEWDTAQLSKTLEQLLEEDRRVLDSVGFTHEELRAMLELPRGDAEEEEEREKGPSATVLLTRLLRETADLLRGLAGKGLSLEELLPRLEAVASRIDDTIGPPDFPPARRGRR